MSSLHWEPSKMSEITTEQTNDKPSTQQESEDSFLKNLDEAASVEEKLLEISNNNHNKRLSSLTANRAARKTRAPTRGVKPGAKLQLKATTDDVTSSKMATRKSMIFKDIPQKTATQEAPQQASEEPSPRRHTMAPAQVNIAAQAMAARTGLRKATVATPQTNAKPATPSQEPDWKNRLRERRQRTLTKEEQQAALKELAEEEKKENKATTANTPTSPATTDTKGGVRRPTVLSPQQFVAPAAASTTKGTQETVTSPKTSTAPKAAVKPATPPTATKPLVQPRKGSNAEQPKEQPKAETPKSPAEQPKSQTEPPKAQEPVKAEAAKSPPERPKSQPKSQTEAPKVQEIQKAEAAKSPPERPKSQPKTESPQVQEPPKAEAAKSPPERPKSQPKSQTEAPQVQEPPKAEAAKSPPERPKSQPKTQSEPPKAQVQETPKTEAAKSPPERPKSQPKTQSDPPVEQKPAVTVTPQQSTPPGSPSPSHAPAPSESSPQGPPRRPTRPAAPIPKVIVEDSEDDAPPKKAQPQPQAKPTTPEPQKAPEPVQSPEPAKKAPSEEPKPVTSSSTPTTTPSTSNSSVNNNNATPEDPINYFVDESGKLRYFDGFLLKRSLKHSRGSKKWKKRWFKLSDEELIYYKDSVPKDTYIRERPPIAVIHLRDVESISPYGKHHAFVLKMRDRSYILDAEDETDLQDWLLCFKVAMDQMASIKQKSASETVNAPWFHSNLPGQVERKEGPLEVREASKWKQRWVILQGGSMVIRKSQKDRKTVNKITLYHSKLGDYLPEKHPYCFMIAAEAKSVVFKTKNEQEFHEWLNVIQFQKVVLEETIDFITL